MDTLSGKLKRLDALKKGRGIQYLLNEGCNILENPILLHDMEYKLIAHTENIVTDDPIWNEFDATGTIGPDWLEFYKNEEFLDAAANAEKTTFLISNKLKYQRILGKLFNCDNLQIGVAALEGFKPFLDDISVLFERFCDILNKEIAKSDYYRNYGQEYQESLIVKLIEGKIIDREIYTAHVGSIYMHLKDYCYLAAVDITQCGHEHTQLSYYRDLFKKTQPAFKYAQYSNYILVIVSTDSPILDIKKDLDKLNRLFQKNNIYAGISSCFDNLYELQKYYQEALSALRRGMGTGNRRIFLYDQLT